MNHRHQVQIIGDETDYRDDEKMALVWLEETEDLPEPWDPSCTRLKLCSIKRENGVWKWSEWDHGGSDIRNAVGDALLRKGFRIGVRIAVRVMLASFPSPRPKSLDGTGFARCEACGGYDVLIGCMCPGCGHESEAER